MQNNRFSTPQRMSRSAIPVMFINQIKRNMVDIFTLLVIIMLSNDNFTLIDKILYPVGGITAIFLLIFLFVYLKYHYCKFYVSNSQLVFLHGVLHKDKIVIPTYKIHSLRTQSGFFYRLFDMKGVSFDTLASKEKEVELILDDADWDELFELVRNDKAPETEENEEQPVKAETESEVKTFKYDKTDLIKGAFCQNHLRGTAILGAVFLAIIDRFDFALESALEYAEENADLSSLSFTSIIVILAAVYLLSILIFLGRILLRYFNLKLEVKTDNLFFESGLITRRSARFSFDKISTLVVKTNILERLFRCSTVSIKQAFNVTDEKGLGNVLIYGCKYAEDFLSWWLGDEFRKSCNITTLQSGRGLFWYSIKYPLLIAVYAVVVIWHFDVYPLLIAVAIFLFFSFVNGVLRVKQSSIELNDDYIVINAGAIAVRKQYLKYSNVEHVRLKCTPFTPIYHRVHLTLYTNGTAFVIRSLKEDEAKEAYNILLNMISDKR